MMRLVPVATVVLLVIACGVVHGLWTDRWAPRLDPATVTARFDVLPVTIGDWESEALGVSPREIQGLTGYLARRYVNRRTGDTVTIALMSGPPRIVSIHTPDVCYAASGFEVAPPSKFEPPQTAEPAEFWTCEMVRTRAAEQTRLRIFYAWNASGTWVAAENPRVAFARSSVLYKLYLIRDLPVTTAPLASDPCLDFFERLGPELRKCLFPETAAGAA
jgi:hypothetical protein